MKHTIKASAEISIKAAIPVLITDAQKSDLTKNIYKALHDILHDVSYSCTSMPFNKTSTLLSVNMHEFPYDLEDRCELACNALQNCLNSFMKKNKNENK